MWTFTPIYKRPIWGGTRLSAYKGDADTKGSIGESSRQGACPRRADSPRPPQPARSARISQVRPSVPAAGQAHRCENRPVDTGASERRYGPRDGPPIRQERNVDGARRRARRTPGNRLSASRPARRPRPSRADRRNHRHAARPSTPAAPSTYLPDVSTPSAPESSSPRYSRPATTLSVSTTTTAPTPVVTGASCTSSRPGVPSTTPTPAAFPCTTPPGPMPPRRSACRHTSLSVCSAQPTACSVAIVTSIPLS